MASFVNRCIWNATSSGLGDFVVASPASNGYTPAQCTNPAVVTGGTYRYFAFNGTDHEEGDGVYTSGTTTLTRTTIRNSSAAGAKVNFAGVPVVTMGGPTAADMSAGGGGMAIGGAVTSGIAGSVLFVDGSSSLGQDNTNFFFDDANNRLKLGSSTSVTGEYWLNGVRALYGVPNVSGTNWFEAGAGNATLTGYLNFGTGDRAMQALTNGYNNTAMGGDALQANMSGHDNIAIGSTALYSNTTGALNIALGYSALGGAVTRDGNIAIGDFALHDLEIGGAGGNSNIAMGSQAALHMKTGGENVFIGFRTMPNITSGTANFNTIIGTNAGQNLGSGSSTSSANTFIGHNCAYNLSSTSTENTWIGRWQGPSAALANTMLISDGQYFVSDCNVTRTNTFSMACAGAAGVPVGLHVYNTTDGIPNTNYERGIFDWRKTSNVLTIGTEAGGTGTVRLIAIDGFAKAGAPAAGDLPSGSFAVIDDTSAGQTWLVFNKAGTIRKVQLT